MVCKEKKVHLFAHFLTNKSLPIFHLVLDPGQAFYLALNYTSWRKDKGKVVGVCMHSFYSRFRFVFMSFSLKNLLFRDFSYSRIEIDCRIMHISCTVLHNYAAIISWFGMVPHVMQSTGFEFDLIIGHQSEHILFGDTRYIYICNNLHICNII